MKVKTNPRFRKMAEIKYKEMLEKGTLKDIFDRNLFGELFIIIDNKPQVCLATFEFDKDRKVFIGSDTI